MSIVARIRAKGGSVRRDGYKFVLKRGRLDQIAMDWIAAHRADLMREIWAEFDDFEERAAIIEYDGCLPRDEAERLAYEGVMGCST